MTTNQGPISEPANQWETGTKDAYLMPPPPTPHRDLTREREDEGVVGTYLTDPGGGSPGSDLLGSEGNIPAEPNALS